jgi:HK97 family phage prohead protease
MSRPDNIEFAGGTTIEHIDASRRGILSRAPAWWRQLAERGTSTQPAAAPAKASPAKPSAPSPQQRSQLPVIGWVAGTCCPGVSRPAFAVHDGEKLPEQFTPNALEGILRQVRSTTGSVPLTWGHDGPFVATTAGLDLVFRMDRLCGLEFEARLRDTPAGRKALAEVDGRSLGVSIGFDKTKSWIVERDGVGRMRVVDEARLHHIAILPRSATLRPAYSAARAYGLAGSGLACPRDLMVSAEAWAFRFLSYQAGARR